MVLDTKFQYYTSSIKAIKPLGHITLNQLISSIRSPKAFIIKQFEAIRNEEDKQKRDSLKEKLYMFTPSVWLDGNNRGYDNIISFNPILVIEWDNLDSERAIYLKHHIFNSFKSCICAFLSPSGKGVKFIFRIPVPRDIEDYKHYWYGLRFYLEDIEPNVDTCNERVTQVLYLSYDPKILSRDDAEEWTKQTAKIDSFKKAQDLGTIPEKEPTEESTKKVLEYIGKFVDKFDGQNGHSLVVKSSTILGGYIAGGEISYEDAEKYMTNLIETHWYLSKKISTYTKTALRFLISGQNGPLTLNYDEE